jgi:hypothetical protein
MNSYLPSIGDQCVNYFSLTDAGSTGTAIGSVSQITGSQQSQAYAYLNTMNLTSGSSFLYTTASTTTLYWVAYGSSSDVIVNYPSNVQAIKLA